MFASTLEHHQSSPGDQGIPALVLQPRDLWKNHELLCFSFKTFFNRSWRTAWFVGYQWALKLKKKNKKKWSAFSLLKIKSEPKWLTVSHFQLHRKSHHSWQFLQLSIWKCSLVHLNCPSLPSLCSHARLPIYRFNVTCVNPDWLGLKCD